VFKGDYLISQTASTPTASTGTETRRPIRTNSELENLSHNLHDVLALIPTLSRGLDVNLQFSSHTAFELTPALLVFDLLDIQLVHGWLVDPLEEEVYRVVVGECKDYNRLVEKALGALSISPETVEFPEGSRESLIHAKNQNATESKSVPLTLSTRKRQH
jgi:hypothetical protein